MTQVGRVVGSDTADVDPSRAHDRQPVHPDLQDAAPTFVPSASAMTVPRVFGRQGIVPYFLTVWSACESGKAHVKMI